MDPFATPNWSRARGPRLTRPPCRRPIDCISIPRKRIQPVESTIRFAFTYSPTKSTRRRALAHALTDCAVLPRRARPNAHADPVAPSSWSDLPRKGHPRNQVDAPRNPTPPVPTTGHARNQVGTKSQMRLPLEAARTWGGARKGAGRKPRGRPSMPHVTRPKIDPRCPVQFTSAQRPACRRFDQRGCSARSEPPSRGLRSIAFG